MAELQRIGPVAAARCEQAALRGDSAAVIDIAEPVLAEAVQLGDQNLEAELAYRLRRAGRAVDVPIVNHPFALQARAASLCAAAHCTSCCRRPLAMFPHASELRSPHVCVVT